MAVQIQIRRDTAAAWTAANPVLAQGELGWETDTFRAKVGDGVTAWASLAYRFESGGGPGTIAIEESNVSVDTSIDTFNFDHGFDVASTSATEARIDVDETELSFSGSAMTVGKAFSLTGDISDTISANTDNYAPTGFADAGVVRITASGANRNLTGIAGGTDGRIVYLTNVGSFNVVLVHDATSTAANRFFCPGGFDHTLAPNASATLLYDSTSQRWRVLNHRIYSSATPNAVGTAASGGSGHASRDDHVHAAVGATPSTQAFGDAAVIGTSAQAAQSDHKHAMPANPNQDAAILETLALQGDISDTISANQDNYTPTGLADATVLRITPSGATRTITGITGGADGRVLVIENIGTQILILAHDATSTAANRFYCPGSLNLQLDTNTAAMCIYDNTSQRWRVIGQLVLGTNAPNPVGTAAAGTAAQASHQDHVHATGASTPTTQAFGDAATTGTGPAAAMTDHKHGMPTNPSTDLAAVETFALQGDITPAQITATQNDYAPTGIADATVLNLSTDALRAITGLGGGADGRVLILRNVGGFPIRLDSGSSGSAAANRFLFPRGYSIYLNSEDTIAVMYDTTAASGVGRWRVMDKQSIVGETLPQPVGTQDDGGTSTTEAAKVDHGHAFPATSTLGHLIVADSLVLTDAIGPTDIGTQNDWNPAGLSTATVIRWVGDGSSTMTVTSIANPTEARILFLLNATNSSTATITLQHDNGSGGTAANRILCPNNLNFVIPKNSGVILAYAGGTSTRWRVVSTLALSNATPVVESGAGSAGTSVEVSRADHVHPAAAGSSMSFATLYKWGI